MKFNVISTKIGIVDCAKELQTHLQEHDDFQLDFDDPLYKAHPINFKYEIYKNSVFDDFYLSSTTKTQQDFIKKHFDELTLYIESSGKGGFQEWRIDAELTLLNGAEKIDCYMSACYELTRGEIVETNFTITSLTSSDNEIEDALKLTIWE